MNDKKQLSESIPHLQKHPRYRTRKRYSGILGCRGALGYKRIKYKKRRRYRGVSISTPSDPRPPKK